MTDDAKAQIVANTSSRQFLGDVHAEIAAGTFSKQHLDITMELLPQIIHREHVARINGPEQANPALLETEAVSTIMSTFFAGTLATGMDTPTSLATWRNMPNFQYSVPIIDQIPKEELNAHIKALLPSSMHGQVDTLVKMVKDTARAEQHALGFAKEDILAHLQNSKVSAEQRYAIIGLYTSKGLFDAQTLADVFQESGLDRNALGDIAKHVETEDTVTQEALTIAIGEQAKDLLKQGRGPESEYQPGAKLPAVETGITHR